MPKFGQIGRWGQRVWPRQSPSFRTAYGRNPAGSQALLRQRAVPAAAGGALLPIVVLALSITSMPPVTALASWTDDRAKVVGAVAPPTPLAREGKVWAWGGNNVGQVGDSTAIDRAAPVLARGPGDLRMFDDVMSIAANGHHSQALRSDGTVWAWGSNYWGELGDGTWTSRPAPVRVVGLNGVIAIAAGPHHVLAVQNNGTVWSWGYNGRGQLGDGSFGYSRATPVRVHGLNDVTAVAAGEDHSLALKNDGTVWAWGENRSGQLGDGTTNGRLTPVQVHGLSEVTAVAAGKDHSLALRADGTVWAWGAHYWGQLGVEPSERCGDPPYVCGRTPAKINGIEEISAISSTFGHNLALKRDGTVWAWGFNSYGQLGDGTRTNRPTPVQVTGVSDATVIAAGGEHSLALLSDGTARAWGINQFGELGASTGSACPRNPGDAGGTPCSLTPVPVSGLTDVSLLGAGYAHSLAISGMTPPSHSDP
jgi:alpha-tubulin suppressor-like RCC1 family protein